jgi:predicted nucleic acid-binding protein
VPLVIADTSPISYLILIGHSDLLPVLFEKVTIPGAVRAELASAKAPAAIRNWMTNPPVWLETRDVASQPDDPSLNHIDTGERAAIRLAVSLDADLLLVDDRKAVSAAAGKGLRVTGTLGILDRAAEQGLVDFEQAIQKLARTNFRRPASLLAALLEKHRKARDA